MRRIVFFGVVWVLACGAIPSAQGQLLAPGKLISAHTGLEGLTNCTTCHQFGKRGVQNEKCLDCHTPLQQRIQRQEGYHAGVADQNCATCHKDHFGRAFEIVRFDTTRFDHDREVGFDLLGAHKTVGCQDCHQPNYITDAEVRRRKSEAGALNKTYLGVSTLCTTCHASDGAHGTQFKGQECETCHTEETWETAPRFDHSQSRYALTGRHQTVSCDGCHKPLPNTDPPEVQYTGIAFSTCVACHADPHQGTFGADCETCHTSADWARFSQFPEDRFDHNQTGFTLEASHARIPCAACHAPTTQGNRQIRIAFASGDRGETFPRPLVENCTSCHVDTHEGVFRTSAHGYDCARCHGSESWTPAGFDLVQHNRESTFVLTGGHQATPCGACHQSTDTADFVFDIVDQSCEGCHTPDSPHGTEFAETDGSTACESCHITDRWRIGNTFDHAQTEFPLTGRHMQVSCKGCHAPPTDGAQQTIRFRGLSVACGSCHALDDPHEAQFAGTDCGTCHDAASFLMAAFDHNATRFPLEGGHQTVACRSCHMEVQTEAGKMFTLYKPLDMTCEGCHVQNE